MKKIILISVILCVSLSSNAFAASYKLIAGVDYTTLARTQSGANVTFDPKLGYGGGVGIELKMGRRSSIGFETGVYYFQRKVSDGTVDMTMPAVHAPFLLKMWMGKFFFLGAGGYLAQGFGNVKVRVLSTGSSTDLSYGSDEIAMRKLDYGAMASVGLNFHLSKKISLVVEGRYLYGIGDISRVVGRVEKLTAMQGFVGFRFGQKKRK